MIFFTKTKRKGKNCRNPRAPPKLHSTHPTSSISPQAQGPSPLPSRPDQGHAWGWFFPSEVRPQEVLLNSPEDVGRQDNGEQFLKISLILIQDHWSEFTRSYEETETPDLVFLIHLPLLPPHHSSRKPSLETLGMAALRQKGAPHHLSSGAASSPSSQEIHHRLTMQVPDLVLRQEILRMVLTCPKLGTHSSNPTPGLSPGLCR